MADYRVRVARSARKELQRLERSIASRLIARIEGLAQSPRPSGCVKLTGAGDLWRIRVADYRIVYAIDDDRLLVDVLIVRHRRDAYRQ